MFWLKLAVLPTGMLEPTAPPNEPELTDGKDPVYWFLANPLLSKYCGVL